MILTVLILLTTTTLTSSTKIEFEPKMKWKSNSYNTGTIWLSVPSGFEEMPYFNLFALELAGGGKKQSLELETDIFQGVKNEFHIGYFLVQDLTKQGVNGNVKVVDPKCTGEAQELNVNDLGTLTYTCLSIGTADLNANTVVEAVGSTLNNSSTF